MIGFNRRFDPNSASLKTAFDGGEIGRGKLLSIISLDPAPPPLSYAGVSVGFVRNMVIHDFDMCAVPFGLKERVMAHGSCVADPAIGATGHVDTAVAVLSYADERIATIRNSRRAALGYDQRVELLRSTACSRPATSWRARWSRELAPGVASANPVLLFLEPYMRAYAVELPAFMDACTEGAPVPGPL